MAQIALAVALSAAIIGCGDGGTTRGAIVTVYVSSPLNGAQATEGKRMCRGARGVLARSGGRAGLISVRAVCLDDTGGGRYWSLAAVGANARHAAENSATMGYIGDLDAAATRFSRPITNAAGIAQLSGMPGAAAMTKLLKAIRAAGDAGSLRESVRKEFR